MELASPNGAMVALAAAGGGAVVLAGCLRNASAVAAAARDLGRPVGVVAAERDVSRVVPRLSDGAFAQLSWPG